MRSVRFGRAKSASTSAARPDGTQPSGRLLRLDAYERQRQASRENAVGVLGDAASASMTSHAAALPRR